MCCLRSTCALPLLPSTLFGHTAMPPAVPTRALSLHPQFSLPVMPDSPRFYCSVWKIDPLSEYHPLVLASYQVSQEISSFSVWLTAPNPTKQKSHQGGKKNIFSTSSAKKKKICLEGPEHRGNIIPLYWVSGESSRVISTQTASLRAILSTTEGFNNPF